MELIQDIFGWNVMEYPPTAYNPYIYSDKSLDPDPLKGVYGSPHDSGIQTMPPSSFVDKFMIKGYPPTLRMNKYGFALVSKPIDVLVSFNVGYIEKLVSSWKRSEFRLGNLINREHRFIATWRGGVYNDSIIKRYKWNRIKDELYKLISEMKVDGLSLSYDYINDIHVRYHEKSLSYINWHDNAHPVPKWTWTQLLLAGKMDALCKFTKDTVNVWRENFYKSGNYGHHPKYLGLGNSRTPDFDLWQTEVWRLYIDRVRRGSFPAPLVSVHSRLMKRKYLE